MPVMDYRVVTFLMSLPWESKMRNGYTKSILRDALKDIVPIEILERKSKIGFSAPLNSWIHGSWKTNLVDLMNTVDFNNSSIIDPQRIKKSINKFFNKSNTSFSEASNIWQALVPYFWEQTMLKK
jgi:asparagine synthase (glutamine-hydrolysing)